MVDPDLQRDLTPFRRRIRVLRVWRCAAIGGCAGAGAAVGLAVLDYFGVHYVEPLWLAAPVALGIGAGAAKALWERLPDSAIARSVDRRGGLEDRLTTATEVPGDGDGLAEAAHRDAQLRISSVRPSILYPLRPGRWHGGMVLLGALAASVFLLGNTMVLRSPEEKKNAAEMKETAKEVERIARPVLEEAKRSDATEAEKELARQLQRYQRDLAKARMSRQEALLKANDLAEKARKIEEQRTESLARSVESAQTAAERMEKMAQQAGLPKMDMADPSAQAQLAERSSQLAKESDRLTAEASSLEKAIAEAERRLSEAGKNGKPALSEAERKAMEKKLAAMQKQLQELQKRIAQVKLSQQAMEFLQKLAAQPEYQEAMKLLQKLQQQAQAQQSSQQGPMTPEQMEEAAKRMEAAAKQLEELARQYGNDEQLKQLARMMLEAAKNAKACKGGQCANPLLAAMGLSSGNQPGDGPPGLSLGGTGRGGRSNDRWVGPHGNVQKSDESSLLNVKFEDRMLNSQQGREGSQTYTEVIGPSAPGGKTAVPYEKVLPKYERSAESALQKSDIPPRMRGKVRDYFDSLRK